MMAADHALDIRMLLDQPAHRLAVAAVDPIHVVEAGAERRMVHEEQRRPVSAPPLAGASSQASRWAAYLAVALPGTTVSRPISRTGWSSIV